MRRLGIIVLVLGLAGFFFASRERAAYDTVQGTIKSAVSTEERKKKDTWETLRWVSLGAAVFGLVLIVLPGKKT